MTQAQYAPTSLELEAQTLGGRHSKTQAEREQIAEDCHDLLARYELQGGRYALRWLERHAGFAHSTAVSYRDAGYAFSKGVPKGKGVSYMALCGRYLRQGKTLSQALATAADLELRKAAAAEAGIGIGKVKYPTALTTEVANTYAALAVGLDAAGLPQQGVPEMTVTMTRLAKLAMTPSNLQHVEAGGINVTKPPESGFKPSFFATDFYSWLARQPCCICGDPGAQLHHLFLPDLPNAPGGRRHHDHKAQELLLPCCLRHHQTAREAAHGMKQADWSTAHFGRSDGAIIRAARYLSEWAQETGVLRGGQ